jgi:predicted lipid-binding transport protein (Tim44 family)
MGLKKKLQAARLTAEERRSASQGATRHAMNGMMAGMMAGSLAGLAVFPFAPITAPGTTTPAPFS